MSSRQKTPPRQPLITHREVTPARSNSSSLPDAIQAQLILDIHNANSNKLDGISFVWRSHLYKGFDRAKVRKRFYFLRELRCRGNQAEWRESVAWALNQKKGQSESELAMSEFSSREVFAFVYLSCSQNIFSCADSSSDSSDSSDSEVGKEFEGLNLNKETPPRKPQTRNQRKAQKPKEPPAKKKMASDAGTSAGAAAADAFVSQADADVDNTIGTAENVFLSEPYSRLETKGGQVNEHTLYSIVVLAHSSADSKAVTANSLKGSEGGSGLRRVRVSKPKYPSFMFGNKQVVLVNSMFGTNNPDACKGFSQAVYKFAQANKTYVDVHLPNRIHQTVRRLTDTHLKLMKSGQVPCPKCHMKEILEIPNITVFEVEEVDYKQTATRSSQAQDLEAEMSE